MFTRMMGKLKNVHETLTEHKLMLAIVHFNAVRPLMDLDISRQPGILRISFLHYNSMGEINQLLNGLKVTLEN